MKALERLNNLRGSLAEQMNKAAAEADLPEARAALVMAGTVLKSNVEATIGATEYYVKQPTESAYANARTLYDRLDEVADHPYGVIIPDRISAITDRPYEAATVEIISSFVSQIKPVLNDILNERPDFTEPSPASNTNHHQPGTLSL